MSITLAFKSTRFHIEINEDKETNPRRYGRQLALWLKSEFELLGYKVEEIIPEDWGWCVMCQREPFSLWIGCGNQDDSDTANENDPPPSSDEVVWECFAQAEVPFLKRIFQKTNTAPAMAKLENELLRILQNEKSIHFVNYK